MLEYNNSQLNSPDVHFIIFLYFTSPSSFFFLSLPISLFLLRFSHFTYFFPFYSSFWRCGALSFLFLFNFQRLDEMLISRDAKGRKPYRSMHPAAPALPKPHLCFIIAGGVVLIRCISSPADKILKHASDTCFGGLALICAHFRFLCLSVCPRFLYCTFISCLHFRPLFVLHYQEEQAE